MLNLAELTEALRQDIVKVWQLEQDRVDLLNRPGNPALKDEQAQDLQDDIERRRKRIDRLLNEFVAFPPFHVRHAPFLNDFAAKGGVDKSVFIMTKFPDPKKPAVTDPQLQKVVDAVRAAVVANGYVPRVASDQAYHAQLWDNVELHLLACRQGIAIVEDKVLPELNPNVAMEWGWMRGLGRRVLYLVEKDFQKARADWSGLIESPFDWANPAPEIDVAVKNFLAP
jgi:hypothetical protein